MRPDSPRGLRDRDTRYGRNELEREKRAHDGLQGSDPGQAVRFGWMLTSLISMLTALRVHQAG
jgi:hypothetical protein